MKPANYFTINDVADALGIGATPAAKLLAGLPFETMRSDKNHKLQRIYHADVVLPVCVKHKKAHTIPAGYLTAEAASQKYGISVSRLGELARAGKIPFKTKMRARIFPEAEISKYVQAARNKVITVARIRSFLNEASYLFNQMKEAFFIDSTNDKIIDAESVDLFKLRRANLITKLQELEL